MIEFATLLERLAFTPSRNMKLALLKEYFSMAPDPDRGYALAAMAGSLSFAAAKPAMLRALAMERIDPELFTWSYDYVGDLAETVALIWRPETGDHDTPEAPSLAEVVHTLERLPKADVPDVVREWLDVCDASSRYALLKLITGSLRVGASARLAKTALAELASVAPDDIEEVWHGLEAPYESLFAWVEGKGSKPDAKEDPVFRPPMLDQPLENVDLTALDPSAWRAAWKLVGIPD